MSTIEQPGARVEKNTSAIETARSLVCEYRTRLDKLFPRKDARDTSSTRILDQVRPFALAAAASMLLTGHARAETSVHEEPRGESLPAIEQKDVLSGVTPSDFLYQWNAVLEACGSGDDFSCVVARKVFAQMSSLPENQDAFTLFLKKQNMSQGAPSQDAPGESPQELIRIGDFSIHSIEPTIGVVHDSTSGLHGVSAGLSVGFREKTKTDKSDEKD